MLKLSKIDFETIYETARLMTELGYFPTITDAFVSIVRKISERPENN